MQQQQQQGLTEEMLGVRESHRRAGKGIYSSSSSASSSLRGRDWAQRHASQAAAMAVAAVAGARLLPLLDIRRVLLLLLMLLVP